jgi:hypothetical protein
LAVLGEAGAIAVSVGCGDVGAVVGVTAWEDWSESAASVSAGVGGRSRSKVVSRLRFTRVEGCSRVSASIASRVASIASRSSLRFRANQRRLTFRPPKTANTQTIVIPSHIIAFLSPTPGRQWVGVNSTTLLIRSHWLKYRLKYRKRQRKILYLCFCLFRLSEFAIAHA